MELSGGVDRLALDFDELQLRIGKLQQREAAGPIAFIRRRQHRLRLRSDSFVQRLRFGTRIEDLLIQIEQRGVQVQTPRVAFEVDALTICARGTLLEIRTTAGRRAARRTMRPAPRR